MSNECGAKSPDGKHTCERPAFHSGAHIEYGMNGVHGWGGAN